MIEVMGTFFFYLLQSLHSVACNMQSGKGRLEHQHFNTEKQKHAHTLQQIKTVQEQNTLLGAKMPFKSSLVLCNIMFLKSDPKKHKSREIKTKK